MKASLEKFTGCRSWSMRKGWALLAHWSRRFSTLNRLMLLWYVISCFEMNYVNHCHRVHSPPSWCGLVSICIHSSCRIYSMNSSWVFGKLYLLICCASFMPMVRTPLQHSIAGSTMAPLFQCAHFLIASLFLGTGKCQPSGVEQSDVSPIMLQQWSI